MYMLVEHVVDLFICTDYRTVLPLSLRVLETSIKTSWSHWATLRTQTHPVVSCGTLSRPVSVLLRPCSVPTQSHPRVPPVSDERPEVFLQNVLCDDLAAGWLDGSVAVRCWPSWGCRRSSVWVSREFSGRRWVPRKYYKFSLLKKRNVAGC